MLGVADRAGTPRNPFTPDGGDRLGERPGDARRTGDGSGAERDQVSTCRSFTIRDS